MASNNYYNSSSQQQYPYDGYDHERDLPPVPSYTTHVPQARPMKPSVSPFEAPFDDHVYPARPQDSQSSFGQGSYYNQGRGGFRDEIPLQDQQHKINEPTDHVYDARDAHNIPRPEDGGRGPRGGRGMFRMSQGRTAWVVWFFTIIQVAVFIAEIVKNAQLTGSPIMIKPSFNPMIGPSSSVYINMGARYVPCMHNVTGIQDSTIDIQWPCPNTTSSDANDPSNHCTLSELCGFGGVPNPGSFNPTGAAPNQWFRFITPIFLHAGVVHIGFNMLLQVTLGRDMEKTIGPIRFFIVYLSAGIFGFVLGGNFAATGIASTGASGSLFGIIALTLLDLLYNWSERKRPWVDLAFIGLDVVISFVLGLLPGLDNFSHIGGFLMGLVLGVCILRSPTFLQKRIRSDEPPYAPVSYGGASNGDGQQAGVTGFVKSPVSFFKGRKSAWWAWWLVRVAALIAVVIVFILLLNNFYVYRKTCSWCKYLSCLPVNGWCDIGNLQLTNLTSKRDLLENWDLVAKMYI